MELRINDAVYQVTGAGELRTRLAEIARRQFSEVWLSDADGWPTICALVNKEAAWLMYLLYEGDAGFSTRNPNYQGPGNAVIEYYLSNGQRDEYPASWNITTKETLHALEYFLSEKKMAPWLRWHEERP